LGPLVELASDLGWLAQPGCPRARVSVLPLFFLPEDGRRSSFRKVVILSNIDDGQCPKKNAVKDKRILTAFKFQTMPDD
jgi:hypothetical protein